MARTRPHRDGCGISYASDLIGQRWALLVVRELLLGPKRFTDLRAGIPDVSPDVLARRLRELERAEIVRQRKLPPPAAAKVYELTDWGAELEPAVLALGRWASKSPSFPSDTEMGPDSLVLALKSSFDPAGRGFDATFELVLGDLPFRIEVSDGSFEARHGEADGPDATLRTDTQTMTALVFRGRSITEAVRAGDLEIEGDSKVAKRFVQLLATR